MSTLTTRRPVTTTDGVMRLTNIARRRLNTGQRPSLVLEWLRSASTAEAFGREAVRVVDVLFAGGAR